MGRWTAGILSTAVAGGLLFSLVPPVRLTAQQPDSFPTRPPKPAPLAPVRFPPFQQVVLPNGLTLVVIENHEQPVVSASLNFRAGDYLDPAGKVGLATMVADLLTKGTATRTADQISAAIEGVGGSLSASAGADFLSIDVGTLTDGEDLAFQLLGDVALHSTFPAAEVELSRTRALSSLELALSQPASLADRFFSQELYGKDPYGRSATATTLKAITRDDVAAFASSRLRPRGALLVVAGDITLAQARALAEKAFAGWRGTPPAVPPEPAPPAKTATDILLVHRPGSAQSNIILGNLTQRPGDSAYYALRVASQVLGGGDDARLFLILREQKSWTYGSYSSLNRVRGIGYWQTTFEGRTEVTDSALGELLHQVDRMRTETVPDSELANTRGFLVGVFPLTIETPDQIASQVATIKLLGLPEDYLRLYRERLGAVSAARVRAAAQRFFKRDALTIVVVGDGAKVYSQLKAIAPVRIVDPDGNPLKPEDLTPKAQPVSLDPAQIVSRTDSFHVTFQGKDFGSDVMSVRRTADSLTFTENEVLGPVGTQLTTLALRAADLSPLTLDQSGTLAGQKQLVHLVYAGGRVKGHISQPQPTGAPSSIDVDTALAAGTYDENCVAVLVPALALAPGQTFTVNTFSSGDGAIRTLTLKVAGLDSVTVPAGTFRAYQVQVTGGTSPFVLYVSADSPRRVVKIEVVGQPLVFELLNK